MSAILARIAVGVRRHPARTASEICLVYAALWGILEPAQAFLQFSFGGWPRFAVIVILSLLVGIWRAVPPDEKTVRIAGTNSCLTVAYGDLFQQPGTIAVPVNDFFDSRLGDHVAPASVHGQAISKLFGGDSARFDRGIALSLAGTAFEKVARSSGHENRYPVGTTAHIPLGQQSVLAFALTSTDLVTLKVSADVPQMWRALHGLWQGARVHCNDRPLVVPLVGGGLSGVGLSPQHLLSLIVISASTEMRRLRICGDVKICLMERLRAETDIEAALTFVG